MRDDGVVVSLPAAALSDHEVPLSSPVVRADATDQKRTLYGAPTATNLGVPLQCGMVEILAELPGNVQQLRQVHEGIELRGFTRMPLAWSWDSNRCDERVVLRREAGESTPSDFVATSEKAGDDAVRYLKRGKPLYRVDFSDSGLLCAKVTYADGGITVVESTGKGLARTELEYGVDFRGGGNADLTGPGIKTFDENGDSPEGMALGCLNFVQFVRETPTALEVLHTKSAAAYHPDDVTLWYKSQSACEAAIAAHPRVPLQAGSRGLAAVAPLRMLGGCS